MPEGSGRLRTDLTRLKAEGYAIAPTIRTPIGRRQYPRLHRCRGRGIVSAIEALAENGKVIVTGCLEPSAARLCARRIPKSWRLPDHAAGEVSGRRSRASTTAA
jgi:hypothetical protein